MEDHVNLVRTGRNVLLTGPGGVGKSTILKRLTTAPGTCVTATTGAAAVLIGGRTLHSCLGIGLGRDCAQDLLAKVSRVPTVKRVWVECRVLIVDEVSMLPAALLDKLEFVARRVRERDEPFGGIQLVLSGDFLQLPCIDGEFCFKAKCWNRLDVRVVLLTEVRRQVDNDFRDVLGRARLGRLTERDIAYLSSGGRANPPNDDIVPTKIMCKNADVDRINAIEMAKLRSSQTYTYETEIEILNERYKFVPKDYCNAPIRLTLAVGANVMLLVNLNQTTGLVNGSRGVVVAFDDDDLPVVKFARGTESITVGYHTWDVKIEAQLVGKVHAIPLRLAYAITCHKSQGCTIDCALVDLAGVFEYGQAYVALSRVRALDSLTLKNATVESFQADPNAIAFYESLIFKPNLV